MCFSKATKREKGELKKRNFLLKLGIRKVFLIFFKKGFKLAIFPKRSGKTFNKVGPNKALQ